METIAIHWKPVLRKLSDLKDWEKNPRKITDEALAKLKSRIVERGFHDIVKVDTNSTILSGTQRRKALESLGVDEVWTLEPDRELTEQERTDIVLESNRNDGDWDWSILKDFGQDVLIDIGFTSDEIRVNFGLDTAGDVDMSQERLTILVVLPPETPALKERAAIKFKTIEDYNEVKDALKSSRLSADKVLELIRK